MWVLCLMYFLLFKHKTAYEVRISDWSSDVCSSDLGDLQVEDDEQDGDQAEAHVELAARVVEGLEAAFVGGDFLGVRTLAGNDVGGGDNDHRKPDRSEERRVGKEFDSTCRSTLSPPPYKEKI